MRDYLKLEEIQRILEGQLTKEEVRHIMDIMEIEAISNIVKEELRWHIKTTEQYLEDYKTGKYVAIHTTDGKEDVKQLKKDLKAFKRVLAYYLIPGENYEQV